MQPFFSISGQDQDRTGNTRIFPFVAIAPAALLRSSCVGKFARNCSLCPPMFAAVAIVRLPKFTVAVPLLPAASLVH